MPLIDLKTNLKDLKFGRDERGGGSSNQPYVVTKIPAANENSPTGFLGIPLSGAGDADFIIRGGTLLPNSIINDEIRLGKFFASTEGVLFTIKQNLLSRIAVKTQASPNLLNGDIYTPLSTLTQAAVLPFGTHVNKQGLNPFAETGPNATNEKLYGVKVTPLQSQNDNRLVNLYGAKILINPNFRFSDPRFTNNNDISPDRLYLLSYQGGPGSILGIGPTKIKLASNPIINITPEKALSDPKINYLTLGYRGLNTIISPTQVTDNGIPNVESLDYELGNFRNTKDYIPALYQIDFRKSLVDRIKEPTTLMSKAPSYEPGNNKIIEQRVNLGDPGNASGKNLISYTNGYTGNIKDSFGAASENSYDKINALPVYRQTTTNTPSKYNDLVKFRIGVFNNNNPLTSNKEYIHFRAFLDQISDNYSSTWDPTKYIGRGENFYTYNGFDRKVSLSWTVAAQSKIELMPMYRKLNYLASLCAPDYSADGYMRGNIITLTIGGYFYEQPGIITSLNYEMNDENSTWEIGINDEGGSDSWVKELPHLIKVNSFNFTPIHTFVPRKQQNEYGVNSNNKGSGIISLYGDERYISLANGEGPNNNNYQNITTETSTTDYSFQDTQLANFTTP